MRLKPRTATPSQVLTLSSTHSSIIKTCRSRRLILALCILIGISVITSLLTVGHLHCRSPRASGRRRGAATGQRELRVAERGQGGYQDEDRTDPSLLCVFTTFKPVHFKLQVIIISINVYLTSLILARLWWLSSSLIRFFIYAALKTDFLSFQLICDS